MIWVEHEYFHRSSDFVSIRNFNKLIMLQQDCVVSDFGFIDKRKIYITYE